LAPPSVPFEWPHRQECDQFNSPPSIGLPAVLNQFFLCPDDQRPGTYDFSFLFYPRYVLSLSSLERYFFSGFLPKAWFSYFIVRGSFQRGPFLSTALFYFLTHPCPTVFFSFMRLGHLGSANSVDPFSLRSFHYRHPCLRPSHARVAECFVLSFFPLGKSHPLVFSKSLFSSLVWSLGPRLPNRDPPPSLGTFYCRSLFADFPDLYAPTEHP